jgi:hypothetical protein
MRYASIQRVLNDHRGPGFLCVRMICSLPTHSPSPPVRQQVASLSQSSRVSPVELTDGRGGGRWWAWSRIIPPSQESLAIHNSFNTLCIHLYYLSRFWSSAKTTEVSICFTSLSLFLLSVWQGRIERKHCSWLLRWNWLLITAITAKVSTFFSSFSLFLLSV